MMSKRSPGITNFENCSIPFSTPLYTIQMVTSRNISINTIGRVSEVIKPTKYPSPAASTPSVTI